MIVADDGRRLVSMAPSPMPGSAPVAADRSPPLQATTSTATNFQMLVRFENERTFVLNLPVQQQEQRDEWSSHQDENSDPQLEALKYRIRQMMCRLFVVTLSTSRCCSPDDLVITNFNPPFCNCSWNYRVRGIRGGKGGFGTLLKGQSRQASAKTTKDFSACRDLQGRRLRHVNDTIHQSIVDEWQMKIRAGTATQEQMITALTQTNSGIAGWHLQVPAWSEVSYKKEYQHNKRLLRRHQREQEIKQQQHNEHRQRIEQQLTAYVTSVDTATQSLERNMTNAIQQGLQKQKEKAAAAAAVAASAGDTSSSATSNNKRFKEEPEPPVSLLTLSGDANLALESGNRWRLQSQSNFCTFGIMLDQEKVNNVAAKAKESSLSSMLYYEIMIPTTDDVIQIGWATLAFRPDSTTGDGVGDDNSSWAYDPSRSIKLHGEESVPFGDTTTTTTTGDVVIGCFYNCQTHEISFTRNSSDLGVAYNIGTDIIMSQQQQQQQSYVPYPAISCNPGVIVEIRLRNDEFDYCPPGAIPIDDVTVTEPVTLATLFNANVNDDNDDGPTSNNKIAELETDDVLLKHPEETHNTIAPSDGSLKPEPTPPLVVVAAANEPLNLDTYESVEALERLGLDRLKSALTAEGLKCGGTLQERAARLFAIRGLARDAYPTKLLAKKS